MSETRAVLRSREFLESLLDAVREPLVVLDQELRVLSASRAFYNVFHVKVADTIGSLVYDLGERQWDIPELRELLENVLPQKTSFLDHEVTHSFPVLGRRTMVLSAKQIPRILGRNPIILLAIDDITDRKLAEAERQKEQRIESLGMLASGIAHDFNNLLAGLMANTELMRLHLKSGEPEAVLGRIERTTAIFARGRALTRRLLTFTKGGTLVREPTSLGPLLAEWAEFALMGSDLTAKLAVAPDLWLCECDRAQVSQLFSNLLINARQASPEAGVVTVTARNVLRPGPFLSIRIHNHGSPIPIEMLLRIFDPFFTTKSEGSGLGLAIAHSIVRHHGGELEVESEDGKGTSLTVFLPALVGEIRSFRPDDKSKDFAGSGIALVMDDDKDLRDAVGEILLSLGFETFPVANGEEALILYREILQKGFKIEVFLLDQQIPGRISGLTTAQRLKELGATGQIIVMSGLFGPITPGVQEDDDGFWRLSKPFTNGELCRILSSTPHEASPVRHLALLSRPAVLIEDLKYAASSRSELVDQNKALELGMARLQQEGRKHSLLEFNWSGNLGHWAWDAQTNDVTFNPLKILALGFTEAELPKKIGHEFFTSRIHPDDYGRVMKAMAEHLQGRDAVYEVEYRIKAKDNSWKWFYDRGVITLRDPSGPPKTVEGIVFDITTTKLLEESLQQKNEELSEANATKDRLFSIIAHDLRGPIAGFVALLDLLTANTPETEKELAFSLMKASAESIFALLENLLKWAAVQDKNRSSVTVAFALSSVVEEVADLVSGLVLEKGLILTVEDAGVPPVRADKDMISTVLRNLVSNAIKFTPRNGRLGIGLRLLGERVEISVTDTGIGLSQEHFEKVVSLATHRVSHGTEGEKGSGLGLILCRDMVEKSGGKLELEGRSPVGSRFFFSLPLA